MNDDLFKGHGVEVRLAKADDFLKAKETLTRIGVASAKDNNLYQSCHILHKQGRYAIMHFKELFALDGKATDITDNDLARRNTIAKLLSEWKLVTLVGDVTNPEPVPVTQIKIISFSEKGKWNLVAKYSIGKKLHNDQNATPAD